MGTRLYLRDEATDFTTGTLPTGFGMTDGTASAVNVTGADTNRSARMAASVTGGQTTASFSTLANTLAQLSVMRRFVTPPLASQVFATGTWAFGHAISTSNTNSNFICQVSVEIWRPSSGAQVAQHAVINGATATAAEVWTLSSSSTGSARTIVSGDVLVIEILRSATVQSMGTSYTNSFFYNGTTEGSTTTPASYVEAFDNIKWRLNVPRTKDSRIRAATR